MFCISSDDINIDSVLNDVGWSIFKCLFIILEAILPVL